MTAVPRAALAVALATAVGVACGAFGARAPNQPQRDVFACQLAVLKDAVPPEAAEDLVMALRAGNHEYVVRQLLAVGLDRPRIAALAEAYNACFPAPAEPPPEPEAS